MPPDPWVGDFPAGGIDPGENPQEAAEREVLEETGWRPGKLHHLVTYHPTNGTSDATFHLFAADGATHVGDPSDPDESERVEWMPWDEVREEMRAGRVQDGLSLTALLWLSAFE
jgi:8-oxo-dGTP pyrophosphatase MutT (NUDIX family)